MKLSIFTDEVSKRSERAIELAKSWGVSHVEVRSLDSGRFPRAPDNEMEDFHRRLSDAGLAVSGVSPGLFKCAVDDSMVKPGLDEVLPRACEWARRWGTDLVSSFGFGRRNGDTVPQEVVDLVERMASIAQRCGCRLVLENESVCWGDTGLNAADIIRRADHPNLSLCWDPGNAARAGSASPFPDEYRQIRDLVTHVHVKNFDADSGRWSLMESGIVDWPGQLAALREDGFAGFIVVETHTDISVEEFEPLGAGLDVLEENSLRNLHYLRSLTGPGPSPD